MTAPRPQYNLLDYSVVELMGFGSKLDISEINLPEIQIQEVTQLPLIS